MQRTRSPMPMKLKNFSRFTVREIGARRGEGDQGIGAEGSLPGTMPEPGPTPPGIPAGAVEFGTMVSGAPGEGVPGIAPVVTGSGAVTPAASNSEIFRLMV